MKALWNKLDGKKTYITAALVALTVFTQQVGWIDTATMTTLLSLLGAGGLASARQAIKKLER